MTFDLNGPPDSEDEDIPAIAGPDLISPVVQAVEGAIVRPDLISPAVEAAEGGPDEDIPGVVFGDGPEAEEGPMLGTRVGLPDLNMEPNLHQEDMNASDNEGIVQQTCNGTYEFISNEKREAVISALRVIAASNNGKLKKNSTRMVATTPGVRMHTVQRLWTDAKRQITAGLDVDVSHKKSKRCGRKQCEIDYSQIPTIPLRKRTTIRSLAAALHVSKSTLHRRFKIGIIRRHSNTLKPLLKDENKKARLHFCLSMLEQSTIDTDPKFTDMQNIVHIDEKWFNMTKKSKKCYLLPEEEDPYRTVQNKNCIGKLMFLGVLGNPLYDEHGNEIFSGKLGIFPFVKEEPVARTSKNRPKGTLIKISANVNRGIMKNYLRNKVLLEITSNWPEQYAGRTIFIQQDNAKTHVSPMDPEFLAAVEETGLDIRLMQ